MTKFWRISPGENGFLWNEQKANGCIAIGWDEIGDAKNMDKKALRAACSKAGFSSIDANQLNNFIKLPDACVDLIYIDPPFNSNRNYGPCRTGHHWGESKEKRAFEDRHESTHAYIDYMRQCCAQLARVLKQTGSFYYHCDWHASHYVKVMLDQIFAENAF